MKTLYLCEKPSQARDIAAVLGATTPKKGYLHNDTVGVTWCLGHLLELAPPAYYCKDIKPWRMDILPIVPEQWQWVPVKKTNTQLNIIARLLKRVSHVVIATDADREGDLIVRELLVYCHYQGRIERLWLSALDPVSIQQALRALRPDKATYSLYLAALARQRADWLIGMNLTMAATCLNPAPQKSVCSVGRVQTPTLAMVVDRDRRIEDFQPKTVYEVHVQCVTATDEFQALWQPPDDVLDLEGHCVDESQTQAIVNQVIGTTGVVETSQQRDKTKSPPQGYSLSALQKQASLEFGYTAKKTLEIAQTLYEKYKAVSYPRTDCGFLPQAQWSSAQKTLMNLRTIDSTLASLIEKTDPTRQAPIWNDKKVTAHHAIIPTLNPNVNCQAMPTEVFHIYDLIRRRFIMQFLPDYQYQQQTILIRCFEHHFKASANVPQHFGWKIAIHNAGQDLHEPLSHGALPKLTENTRVTLKNATSEAKQTQPPARFSEGTLISAMKQVAKYVEDPALKKILRETAGIGTEATRADIIEKLIHRGFLVRRKKQLISSPKGRQLIDRLPAQIKNLSTTARWEQTLEDIANQTAQLDDFLQDQVEVLEFMLTDLAQTQ